MSLLQSLPNWLRGSRLKPPNVGTSSLKLTLVGAILATVGTTAAIVYIPWAMAARRNVNTLMAQVNHEIASASSQEVKRLFLSAKSAQLLMESSYTLMEGNYTQRFIDLANLKEQEAFFLSTLAANPDFTWIQLGFANGNFLGAQRVGKNELRFHLRQWNARTRTTQSTTRTYEMQGQTLKQIDQQSMQMNPAFYAPDRPWYKGAIAAAGKPAWTVYVYRSTFTPGMDATIRLQQNGKTIGVIGVGVELSQLSRYLQRMKGDRAGEAFILNPRQDLIASTDLQAALPQSTDSAQPKLRKLTDSQNRLIQFASRTIQQQHVNLSQIQSQQEYVYTDPQTGESYRVSLTPTGNLNWVVGTIIPESAYLAEINRDRQMLLMIITLFVVTAAGLAIIAVDRIVTRPIFRIAQVASDIEADQFKPDALGPVTRRTDELGQLARVFQKMAQQIQLREQRLKQQVQELKVEIDETKREKQVKAIVETDFFQELMAKVDTLRRED